MLARRRGFYRGEKEVIRTPLLLPSFSSKGFPEVQSILAATEQAIDGEILVSAYDLHHEKLKGPFDFAQAIFLDSGGYEAGKDLELSDIGTSKHAPAPWSKEQFATVLLAWSSPRPTVFVSYDHPNERLVTAEQIKRADDTLPKRDNAFREILFKPEGENIPEIDIDAVVANIHKLASFDAIGVTEKEIGFTLQTRMASIAKLRRSLDGAGLGNMPIHIFGSLDTISTPLYFVAGADIFDGLTWLRFAYYDGLTIYRQNYAALQFGTQMKTHLVDGRCWFHNYQYMKEMQLEMRNFLKTQSFNAFKHHKDLVRRAYQAALEQTGV
jgi:hypothetical protein